MDDGGVRLDGKDALSLLRLLRGLECLVREERLEERHCAELMGLAQAPDDAWQQRLETEVAAACGLLEEILEGYEPAGIVVAGSRRPAEGRLGGTPDTKASLDLP